MCVNNLSKVALDSAAAGIEPATSSRKSNAITNTPLSHTNTLQFAQSIVRLHNPRPVKNALRKKRLAISQTNLDRLSNCFFHRYKQNESSVRYSVAKISTRLKY